MAKRFGESLSAALPTRATLDAWLAGDEPRRRAVPMQGERMAAPYEFEWRDEQLDVATFEFYDSASPLGRVSAELYHLFVQHGASADTRRLVIGNVACHEFEDAWLLGDPIDVLAREGLPHNLQRLEFARYGPVSNAGDLGFIALARLEPLHARLADLRELELSGCERIGPLQLPRLSSLRLHASVSADNLHELARAQLPALTRLELACDDFCAPEQRIHGMRALLESAALPSVTTLALDNLDLDEDQRLELEDEDPDAEPASWIELLAKSELLRHLQRLELSFRDDERELPHLIAHAAAFRSLAHLEFWGTRGRTVLEFPTPQAIRAALGR